MSPRRSSRARITQPASAPVHTNSSTSSISSGRADRSTRSHNKASSPHASNLPRSLSLDDPDEQPKPTLRRTRSGHEDIKENATSKSQKHDDEEAEEDVTRCICGHTDYPGLPTSMGEVLKQAAREYGDVSASSEVVPEDAGGLFIQCDTCKVWQHGGCLGILDEATSPDEYFCELCRKDLHRLMTASNGQKYSCYLPVLGEPSSQASPEPSPIGSVLRKSKDGKSTRPSAEALAHKRRSTMNSRDAAYDEAEQLRRAIEESKKEGGAPSIGNGSRTKRSRSESEDRKEPAKRQRTNSHSSSSPSLGKAHLPPTSSSDEALAATRFNDHNPKKIRGAAARNHREKEQREQRERERADAAGRRKARSERRRGDESDPSDDPPPRTNATRALDPAHNLPASPETPPASQNPPSKPTSHKKTGRPTTKRGRVGRNQYTKDKDRDLHMHNRSGSQLEVGGADSPFGRGRSRSRSNAADTRGPSTNGTMANGHITGAAYWGETGKPSKPKHMNPNRTSFNEMKRRVAGIMEFVSRTQGELEGREVRTPPGSGGCGSSAKIGNGGLGEVNGGEVDRGGGGNSGKELVEGVVDGLSGREQVEEMSDKQFESLSSAEMMAVLKGKLSNWQREYGVWGEK